MKAPAPQQSNPKRWRVPRGQAAQWTEVEIAALAAVGTADVAQARERWQRHAPEGWEGLLDARASIG